MNYYFTVEIGDMTDFPVIPKPVLKTFFGSCTILCKQLETIVLENLQFLKYLNQST